MDVAENITVNRTEIVDDFDKTNITCEESTQTVEGDDNWYYMPDTVLLNIFQYLTPKELVTVGEVCRTWNKISHDEFLWRDLFYRIYKIDSDIGINPGKTSWFEEFKRLTYHTPLIETEILKQHSHQVLHVSFSHNGKMFATCSKDRHIRVWESQYPVNIKYLHDMKTFRWEHTQFSQFNYTDTLLLVSGVYFGAPLNTTEEIGEIAIFKVAPGFELQCRVVNTPYDVFGAWYSEHYFLSGSLCWLAHQVSKSVLFLNKANQESASEHVPIMTQLFRFYNSNGSYVRAIMVANCLAPALESENSESQPSSSNVKEDNLSHKDNVSTSSIIDSPEEEPVVLHHVSSRLQYSTIEGRFMNWIKLGDGFEYATPIQYNKDYRQVEKEDVGYKSDSESNSENNSESNSENNSKSNSENNSESNSENENQEKNEENESAESSSAEDCDSDELSKGLEKLLIFKSGSKTYTSHQVCFKRVKLVSFPKRLDPGLSLPERVAQRERERERQNTETLHINWLDYESVANRFDKVDHLIDLHGHITGMALSPDHRYLYVNTRPWPKGYGIRNPLQPPSIAQEIDIHIIDLVTLKEVGTMLRAHKAYTPNHEYFFIFLDVCNEYVASGAEDNHGYLWDRHYGICLTKFPHTDVVNSVAFNPKDPEMLVTTSDDHTVKIWRSRAMVKSLGLDEHSYNRGMEVRKKSAYHKPGCNVD